MKPWQTNLSGIEMHLLCHRLDQELAGARIQRVLLGRAGDLILELRCPGRIIWLRLGCQHDAQWCYATAREPERTQAGSPLRDRMARLLEGGHIRRITSHAWRAIAVAEVEADGATHRVVAHLALPERAILLLDGQDALCAQVGILRRSKANDSYQWPAGASGATIEERAACLDVARRACTAEDPALVLAHGMAGLSRSLAKVLVARAMELSRQSERGDPGSGAITALADLLAALAEKALSPCLVRDANGRAIAVLPVRAPDLPGVTIEPFGDYAEAVSTFWDERIEFVLADRLRVRVLNRLRTALQRNARTQQAVASELAAHRQRLGDRTQADLVAANFFRLRRGLSEIEVVDFTRPEQPTVRIPLDPVRTPQENLARLYKSAQRAERGAVQAEARRHQLQQEQATLQAQLALAERAVCATDLLPLASALGIDPNAPLHADRAAEKTPRAADGSDLPPGVRRFVAPSGHEILVGRSAAGNDTLLRRFARGNDLWLHAEGVTGAHVLVRLRARNDAVPQTTVLLAAVIAATCSARRNDDQVAVAVTQAKYVRKRKGDPPGRATYSQERTVVVQPDARIFDRLAE